MGEETSRIRSEIEETRDRMGDTVDALAGKANVAERVKGSVADKRDRVMNQMQGTGSRINDATPDASDVREGAQRAVGVAQENPLGLALGGVAAGFLIGMMLPSTRIEDERIGPMADEVKSKAAETGQEAIDRGTQVAKDVADAAGESAKDVADTAGQSAREAADNVRETARESGTEQAEEMRTA